MKIDLTNVKEMKSLSEETPCYTATVYVDGKATVEVSNHGRGGYDKQHVIGVAPNQSQPTLDKIKAWISENVPKYDGLDVDLELWCHMELYNIEAKKTFKRLCGSQIVYVKDGDLVGVKFKGVRKLQPLHFDIARKEYPPALNLKPFDEAWDIVRHLRWGKLYAYIKSVGSHHAEPRRQGGS